MLRYILLYSLAGLAMCQDIQPLPLMVKMEEAQNFGKDLPDNEGGELTMYKIRTILLNSPMKVNNIVIPSGSVVTYTHNEYENYLGPADSLKNILTLNSIKLSEDVHLHGMTILKTFKTQSCDTKRDPRMDPERLISGAPIYFFFNSSWMVTSLSEYGLVVFTCQDHDCVKNKPVFLEKSGKGFYSGILGPAVEALPGKNLCNSTSPSAAPAPPAPRSP